MSAHAEVADLMESLREELAEAKDRETNALRRIWKAFGCASNPDDFRKDVRDVMWTQVEGFARDAENADRRLVRESKALRAERDALQAKLDRVKAWLIEGDPEISLRLILDSDPSVSLAEHDAKVLEDEAVRTYVHTTIEQNGERRKSDRALHPATTQKILRERAASLRVQASFPPRIDT